MASYYCLMTGLPELTLDGGLAGVSVASLKEETDMLITGEDRRLMSRFYLRQDCLNLVKLLRNPDAELESHGNYDRDQLLEFIASALETETSVEGYPLFMADFVRMYQDEKDKETFFAEDAVLGAYYEYAMQCKNKMVAEWFSLNFNILNILTALIARKNNWNISEYILGDNDINEMICTSTASDFNLSKEYDFVPELMKVADCDDPVEKEKNIDALKWIWLDEHTFFDAFSIEAVFAYFCKLEILERWSNLDPEHGKEVFTQIIEDLRGEAKVPEI